MRLDADNNQLPLRVTGNPFVFIYTAFFAGLIIWIIDAIIDVYWLGKEQTLLENIFIPEPTELWMRTLVVLVLIAVGYYSSTVVIKHIKLDELLRSL